MWRVLSFRGTRNFRANQGTRRTRARPGQPGRPLKVTMQKWSHPCELLLRARLVPDRAGADT